MSEKPQFKAYFLVPRRAESFPRLRAFFQAAMLGGESTTPPQPTSTPPPGPWTLRVCAAVRRRWHVRWERVVSRGTRFPAPALKPEVAETIAKWRTHPSVTPPDQRTRDMLPVVRELVAATEPATPDAARRLSGWLLGMLVWADRTVGSIAPEAINPRNVGQFITEAGEGKTLGWQNVGRTSLQQVGRAVNPAAWSAKLPKLKNSEFCLPYSSADEDLILLACRLPGVKNPAARLWAAAAPLGAGLRSYEATNAEIGDVCELGDGRLAVRVRGRYPRLVPVRAKWTDPVREAISFVNRRPTGACPKFILPYDPSESGRILRALPWGRKESVEPVRVRVTWLAAHLQAGTSVLALRTLAGSLGAHQLHHLFSVLDLSVAPEDAIAEGLRA